MRILALNDGRSVAVVLNSGKHTDPDTSHPEESQCAVREVAVTSPMARLQLL